MQEPPPYPEPQPDRGKRTLVLVLAAVAGCGCLGAVLVIALATLVVPALAPEIERARVELARATLHAARERVRAHALRRDGELPATLAEVDWGAAGLPLDPWDNPIVYARSADGASFTLTSLGADGAPGGDELGADVVVSSEDSTGGR